MFVYFYLLKSKNKYLLIIFFEISSVTRRVGEWWSPPESGVASLPKMSATSGTVISTLKFSGSYNDPIDLTKEDDNIPAAKVGSSSSSAAAPTVKIDCSICWDSIGTQVNPMWTAECGHVYCRTCIEQLTEKKKSKHCSVCRVKISHPHQVFVYI
jgi:hypothetical protein